MRQAYRHLLAPLAALALLAACDRDGARTVSDAGIRQTAFPGQITAGGGSSGAVMARTARPETDATYAGGTPGHAGGAGGTSGGAATAGTVAETGQGPTSGTTPVTGAGARDAPRSPGEAAPQTGAAAPVPPGAYSIAVRAANPCGSGAATDPQVVVLLAASRPNLSPLR
jgi:hypothetical protein